MTTTLLECEIFDTGSAAWNNAAACLSDVGAVDHDRSAATASGYTIAIRTARPDAEVLAARALAGFRNASVKRIDLPAPGKLSANPATVREWFVSRWTTRRQRKEVAEANLSAVRERLATLDARIRAAKAGLSDDRITELGRMIANDPAKGDALLAEVPTVADLNALEVMRTILQRAEGEAAMKARDAAEAARPLTGYYLEADGPVEGIKATLHATRESYPEVVEALSATRSAAYLECEPRHLPALKTAVRLLGERGQLKAVAVLEVPHDG